MAAKRFEPEPVPVDPDEPLPVNPDEPVPVDPDDDIISLEDDAVPEPVLVMPGPRSPEEEEPISLVDDPSAVGESKVRVRLRSRLDGEKREYSRPVNLTGQGATRCRLFHCRVSMGPLEHLQESINEWLDTEELEVKNVQSFIGVMEGKTPEPNMIVMVWY